MTGLILIAAVAIAGAQAGSEPTEDPQKLIDPAALREYVADPAEGTYLVDVRTPEEYVSGHIPTAIQIDYRQIGMAPPTDDKDALIIVYCRSGNRSNSAAQTLTGLGYTNVLDWGGIIRWPYDLIAGPDPE